jgi:hypothetical protein
MNNCCYTLLLVTMILKVLLLHLSSLTWSNTADSAMAADPAAGFSLKRLLVVVAYTYLCSLVASVYVSTDTLLEAGLPNPSGTPSQTYRRG